MKKNEWRTGEFKVNAVEHFAHLTMVIEKAIGWLFSHINKKTQNNFIFVVVSYSFYRLGQVNNLFFFNITMGKHITVRLNLPLKGMQ